MPRIGIYGWGVVAPRCPDVPTFEHRLQTAGSWLEPFDGVGPSTFLVGNPEFDLGRYREWIDSRFPPNKFPQLQQKMGAPTQYAIGAFIQALGDNPGIEQVLQDLGAEAQVLIGTGLGDLPTMYDCSVELYLAQLRWDQFWADPERNSDRRRFEQAGAAEQEQLRAAWGIPEDPDDAGTATGPCLAPDEQACASNRFWMARSDGLADFLASWDAIEAEGVSGEVEAGKLRLIRRKRTALERLQKQWQCPRPPWLSVPTKLLWNIHNTPAAQVSMLGKITGAAFAPVAACSTFGVALHLAMCFIRTGEARAVVVGACDPPPHATSVGTFYAARVLAGNAKTSLPLTDLRGTHVAGGACVWILGDHEYMQARGFKPLGLELLGAGVTSDADHIITPSVEGPQAAIRRAFADAGIQAEDVVAWDLHATATPGDFLEVANLKAMLQDKVLVTARKGIFGHGMAVGGGWELMAQHLGLARGVLQPQPLDDSVLNPEVAAVPFRYVLDHGCQAPPGPAGKLSMGVGGINACIISSPWGSEETRR